MGLLLGRHLVCTCTRSSRSVIIVRIRSRTRLFLCAVFRYFLQFSAFDHSKDLQTSFCVLPDLRKPSNYRNAKKLGTGGLHTSNFKTGCIKIPKFDNSLLVECDLKSFKLVNRPRNQWWKYVPDCFLILLSYNARHLNKFNVHVISGITTVLTLLTIITGSNNNMPKISYMKAIDVYFAGCFFFVFCSLIEFAMVTIVAQMHLLEDCSNQKVYWS